MAAFRRRTQIELDKLRGQLETHRNVVNKELCSKYKEIKGIGLDANSIEDYTDLILEFDRVSTVLSQLAKLAEVSK